MGAVRKVTEVVLGFYFLLLAVVAPLLDAQTCLPRSYFPGVLVDLKEWYGREYGDYLVTEKPNFFAGLVWLELLLQWPLSVANLYAIITARPWLPITCLIHGVSVFTAMVAILAELTWSGKASEKLLMMYYPFISFAGLAIIRGLMPPSGKSPSSVRRTPVARKKRA